MSDFSPTLVLQKSIAKTPNDMAKVQIKSEKVTSFGGFFPIMEQFDALLAQTIDSTLGMRFWIKANIKTKQQWYIVWCMMKYTFNMIREGQEKSDFAKRMNQMFGDVEVACEVNSFRRLENKLNHNRHFSYWTKESDPDYSIAESLYQKLKNKENFTRHE